MFGILSKEQILEYCKNSFTKELGNPKRCNMSDFAYDTLKMIEEINEVGKLYDSYYHSTNYGTSNARYSNNYYPFFDKVGIINKDDYIYKLHLKSLPFIPYLSLDLLPDRIKLKKKSRFETIEFGCYPQSRCNINDYDYDTVDGENLVFVYNADFTKYGYSPRGKISIRKKGYRGKEEEYIYYYENYYKVEPISWIVDNEKNIMFPNSPILFANIPYLVGNVDNQSNYTFNKGDSTIYKFVKNYFIPNALQKENIDFKSLLDVDMKIFIDKKGEDLINDAKEKYTKELKKYISGIKKEELDNLLKNREENLEKLLNERLDSYKKELDKKEENEIKKLKENIDNITINNNDLIKNYKDEIKKEEKNIKKDKNDLIKKLVDYKDEQLNKYNEEISKVEEELKKKLDEFINNTKEKEETFNYVKQQFDNLAKEEFDKKMLPIIDSHIKDLDKIKKDLTLSISSLVSTSYTEFENQVNKIMNSVDSKEKEVNDILNKFKKEFTKLEEEKNKIKEEVKQDLEEIKKYKENISKELEEEVIKRVVEKNPVKEVNITIDNIRKRGVKGLFHQDFEAVLRLVSLKLPVFLVGPAGCGKNVMLKQVAQVLDKKFFYQNDANEDHKLLGFVDANGIYHQTPFYKAFTEGGLLMLDEMDNANASVLLKLNSAIGSGNDFYMTFPNGETLQAHKDFQVVAAANTFGKGENAVYCGRNQLDGATLDRYFIYNLDYDKSLEKTLVNNEDILDLFWDLREIIVNNDIHHTVSTRAILNMDKIISSGIIGKGTFTIGDAFEGTLIKGLDKDDLNIIVSKLNINNKYASDFLKYLKEKYSVSKNAYEENNYYNNYNSYQKRWSS